MAPDAHPVSDTAVAARVSSTVEAQLIAGLLKANGIASVVSADDVGGADPQLQLTEGVRVLVSGEDLAKARALISASEG